MIILFFLLTTVFAAVFYGTQNYFEPHKPIYNVVISTGAGIGAGSTVVSILDAFHRIP